MSGRAEIHQQIGQRSSGARKPHDLGTPRSHPVLSLQQTLGNRTVMRLCSEGVIQPKLTVNEPDDPYEREAERVAARVVAQMRPSDDRRSGGADAAGAVQRQIPEEEEELLMPRRSDSVAVVQRQEWLEEEEYAQARRAGSTPTIQRQEWPEEEEIQARRVGQRPAIQRQEELPEEELFLRRAGPVSVLQRQEEEEEEEELLQPSRSSSGPLVAPGDVESQLDSARGGGQTLAPPVRAEMEQGFGYDFGAVHVHTGGDADRLARRLDAEAFTNGADIFFRGGLYDPATPRGDFLLAHELTHVIQQGAATVSTEPAESQV